jgi:siroheme synthase-like protein
MPPSLYPVFLKLAGLPVVVVGGGAVAAGKLEGLLDAGARVTVVAPAIADAIRARAAHGSAGAIALVERAFAPADLDGARWVVAAATPEVNRQVSAAAAARGLFVNAVDDVASASAYLGAVVRKGSALLAISTSGLAPALAALLPDDVEHWIEIASTERAAWKHAATPVPERRPLLLRALDRVYRSHVDQSGAPS